MKLQIELTLRREIHCTTAAFVRNITVLGNEKAFTLQFSRGRRGIEQEVKHTL